MLSAIFVDRPRLAIVIALGDDDCRPFVAVHHSDWRNTPTSCHRRSRSRQPIPGRIRGVVDATVAQAIEAQVVGVDKMIYMKSVSGDDGSYTLLCSFELGTDPDINTVNVNNRVQIALPSLPDEVQRQGITVKKKSSALLGVVAVYSPKHTLRFALSVQLRDDQPPRQGQEHAWCWRRGAVGTAGLRDARLGPHRPADRPRPDHRRHHPVDPVAERSGRGRPHRRAADLGRSAIAAQHPDKGPAHLGRRVRQYRDPHKPGRLDLAARRCGAARTGCRQPGSRNAVQRRPVSCDCHLSDTRGECDCHPQSGPRPSRRTAEALPRRHGLAGDL